MKDGIHPEYKAAKVNCACGALYDMQSTRGSFAVEVCGACHPFYTGKQKALDTKGRVDKFRRKYGQEGVAAPVVAAQVVAAQVAAAPVTAAPVTAAK